MMGGLWIRNYQILCSREAGGDWASAVLTSFVWSLCPAKKGKKEIMKIREKEGILVFPGCLAHLRQSVYPETQ